MEQIRVDVAVLGAGLAGSLIAKALADKGWATLLLDRHNFPRHKVCGEFLSPEALSTLEAFGLRETVMELEPAMVERSRLVFAGGAEIRLRLPGQAFGLSRYRLDERLHQAAAQAGARLETGLTVVSVHQDEEGYIIEAKRNGAALLLRTRSAIAAWGANARAGLPGSFLRTGHNQGKGRGKSPAYVGVKSHFYGVELDNAVEMYFFRGGYMGLCPIGDGKVNAAALLDRSAFEGGGRHLLSFMEEAALRHPKLAQRLAGAVPVEGAQSAVAPVHLRSKPKAWDGLPLLGDTASMIAPLCGDGMSMALRSAALCAPLADRYLRGAISLDEWNQTYSQLLRSEFTGPLRWGGALQRLLNTAGAGPVLQYAARFAPRLAEKIVSSSRLAPFHS